MSAQPAVEMPEAESTVPVEYKEPGRFVKALTFVWKYFLGVVFMQTLLGAVLVVGWTYRLMQRAALKRWWRLSDSTETFTTFCLRETDTAQHVQWPNWLLGPSAVHPSGGKVTFRRIARRMAGSLKYNLVTGFQALVNTFLLTLPAGLFWWFGWFAGWDNSFNKGYEQSFAGALIALVGIALFIAAMLYVPMAQARQAATGEMRAFFDGRVIIKLIRRSWPKLALLAGLYALAMAPMTLSRIAPVGLAQNPEYANMTDAAFVEYLQNFYLGLAVIILPLYILTHLVAVRIYATAVASALKDRAITADKLRPYEYNVLNRLDMLHEPESAKSHVVVELVKKTTKPFARFAFIVAVIILWFLVGGQVFVQQFFTYQSPRAWLNQPTIQAPWVRYIPNHLSE